MPLVVALLGGEASAQRGRGFISAGIFGLTSSMAVTSAGIVRAARLEGWELLEPELLASESPEPIEPSPSSESLDGRVGGEAGGEAAESEPGSTELSTEDAALLESTRRSAAAQERCDAGDFDGAIALWSELLAEVSPTPEQAPRRASILLAIVDAHERAYIAERDPRRLRVAIELLDHYLGELAPTDDENRVAVEARRSALVQRLGAAATGSMNGGDDAGPVPRGPDPQVQERAARRWTVVGGALVVVGAGGVVLMGAGMGLGRRADDALSAAVDRSPTDPQRSSAIAAAYADGLLANGLAYAGGIAGGLLVLGGSVALLRGRRLRLAPGPVALGLTLGGRF